MASNVELDELGARVRILEGVSQLKHRDADKEQKDALENALKCVSAVKKVTPQRKKREICKDSKLRQKLKELHTTLLKASNSQNDLVDKQVEEGLAGLKSAVHAKEGRKE